MGFQRIVIIAFLLLASCGVKKKAFKKETKLTNTTSSYIETTTIDKVATDSTISFLNIVSLNIVAKDSTQPIKIIDSKGNVTTFVNVKSIVSLTDRSVVKSAINESESVVVTATAGSTTTIENVTVEKSKFKIDTTLIYIGIAVVVIFSLRKYIRKLFLPF